MAPSDIGHRSADIVAATTRMRPTVVPIQTSSMRSVARSLT